MKGSLQSPRRSKHRFVFMLTVAHKRLLQWQAEGGEASGATRNGLLMTLPRDGAARPLGEIGRLLDLGASSMSGLVDRMVASGLIERVADFEDGRAFRIRLTDQGRTARQVAIQRAHLLNDRLSEDFTEDELAVVDRWLAAIPNKFPKEDEK